MAAHLDKGPLGPQLCMLALSALDFCVSRLSEARPDEPVEWASRVHDTRRKLKWLRALLRAVRPELTSSEFRHLDHSLRDVGRKLADARSRAAREVCIRSLGAHFSLPNEDIEGLLAFLETNAPRGRRGDSAEALAALMALRSKLELPIEVEPEHLIAGFSEQARRARKAYRRARAAPTSHLVHEWRKQVKYHLHQLELLRELVPELSERIATMKSLSELLGLSHDVADLAQLLRSRARPAREHGIDLCAIFDAREAELTLRALTQGDALFRSKPRELRALLEKRLL